MTLTDPLTTDHLFRGHFVSGSGGLGTRLVWYLGHPPPTLGYVATLLWGQGGKHSGKMVDEDALWSAYSAVWLLLAGLIVVIILVYPFVKSDQIIAGGWLHWKALCLLFS